MAKMIDWPLYFKDRLVVDNLDSCVGVATLWMPKESVVAQLKPGSFSVCGQLYTKRGITPLLRNVLANPKIRYIVLCGVDRQGSGDALLKFFADGVVADQPPEGELAGWKIVGDDEALLDKELPADALELVRANVELFDMRMQPLDQVAKKVSSLKEKPLFAKPQIFAEAPQPQVTRYPTDMSVFKIKREYVGDAWLDVLKTLNRFGANSPGLYGNVKVVHNLCVIIDKEDPKKPKIDKYLKFDRTGLDMYIKGFFDKDPGSEDYTYGERIFDWDGIDQEAHMVKKLTQWPHDRGALAVLWKPHVDNFPFGQKPKKKQEKQGKTVPCLVMLLGQCLDDEFRMTAVFRNNDMYGAWPLNAFALRQFQQGIAQKIGKTLGPLTTISHIAELYEIDWEDAVKIVATEDSLDRTCAWEPRGYYVIELDGTNIVAKFFTPDGSVQLAQHVQDGLQPKAARDMCAKVQRDMLLSELGAAMDFGRQIAKAEAAVKLGLKFEQDQPLRTV